jgi:hypothetical protein
VQYPGLERTSYNFCLLSTFKKEKMLSAYIENTLNRKSFLISIPDRTKKTISQRHGQYITSEIMKSDNEGEKMPWMLCKE